MGLKPLVMATALFCCRLTSHRRFTVAAAAASTASMAERLYRPHRVQPALFAGSFDRSWLHDDFVRIVDAFSSPGADPPPMDDAPVSIPDSIRDVLRTEMEGVYSFNVFDGAFVDMFNEEVGNFYAVSEERDIPVRRPNSMNNYGVILNEIGMRPMISAFQREYLWPVARHLFPIEASQFDGHHSFMVRYRAGEDLGLDMHTDDSDVTFNVCLGEVFTGATLSFCGMFGAPGHRRHEHTYRHEVGRAVLHLGNRRHGADDIETGRRSNLIVWNTNDAYRKLGGNRAVEYQREVGEPSRICLSYTHDRDYEVYKELPEAARKQKRNPWCPPPGYEAESKSVRGQNEL